MKHALYMFYGHIAQAETSCREKFLQHSGPLGNSPVSQYERPRAVALASSACVDKTTKIITDVTRKDPFFTSEMSELSTTKGIVMK